MVVVAAAHPEPQKVALLRWFLGQASQDPNTPPPPGSPAWVQQTGQSLLMPAVPASVLDVLPDEERREAFRAMGLHSVINVPLTVQGRPIGVLGLATTHPSRTYGEADLDLAHALAARAALALDNAQLHEAADHSEHRYRSLVDATRQVVWTNSPSGEMLGEQAGWTALTGQGREAYEGYGWSEAIHPEDQAYTLQAWRRAVAARSAFDIRHRVRVADGTFRHFHVRAVPLMNTNGSLREWVGVHTDITEQVEARRNLQDLNSSLEQRVQERTHALEERERLFRSIFDSQFQLIGLLTPDGTLIEANRTALDFTGTTLQAVEGKPFWEAPWWRHSEQTRQELREALRRAAAGETVRYDVDLPDVHGTLMTIDFSLKPVRDEQGEVILLIPEGRVISEERRLAAALQAVVSSAPLILFALDRDGQYLLSSGAALATLGRQPNELVGQSAFDVYRELPQVLEPMKRALAGETFYEIGTFRNITLESWYQPLRDQRGQVNGMIGVAIDVSDRARAEQEREEARVRAEVLAALGDALQVVSSPDEMIMRALETVGPALGVSSMVVIPVDRTDPSPVTLWGQAPDVVRATLGRADRSLADTPVLERVVASRQAVYLDDYAHAPEHASGLDGLACAIEPVLTSDGRLSNAVVAWRDGASGPWSAGQQDLLRRGAAALALALERAAQTRHLEEERLALEAFTRFTEAVGSETDVPVLVKQAMTLLVDTCGVDAAYFERDGDLFKITGWSPAFDLTLLPLLEQGFLLEHSGIAQILLQNAAAFMDHWNDTGLLIKESGIYRAVAGHPYFVEGHLQSVLMIGTRAASIWAEREKSIFRAVGRSLELALDRARQTQTVTAQRDALDAQTQQLAASTKELEAFSYSVSHDLRTPVRHMLGFLQLARRSLEGRLDERSVRYLDMVEQAGTQMNTLIDALLDLSNLAQQTLRPTVVDLNEVMAQLRANLLPDLMTRNIQWEVSSLPQVWGDRDAMKQVLSQLTENALKFTRTRTPAVIRIWAEDHGDRWKVMVEDNGLGFDPRHQDRLFNLFQRLHTAQEATGSGVGLASVRRLILKHGGQVFAEGEIGKGATFGFTLPKHPAPRL